MALTLLLQFTPIYRFTLSPLPKRVPQLTGSVTLYPMDILFASEDFKYFSNSFMPLNKLKQNLSSLHQLAVSRKKSSQWAEGNVRASKGLTKISHHEKQWEDTDTRRCVSLSNQLSKAHVCSQEQPHAQNDASHMQKYMAVPTLPLATAEQEGAGWLLFWTV